MEQVRENCGSCGDKLQTHCTCSPLPELTRIKCEIVGSLAKARIGMLETNPCAPGEIPAHIRRLAGERDDAVAEVERLKRAIRSGKALCSYCYETFSTSKDGIVEFQEHIKTCQSHPMRKLLDDNAVLKSALAGLALEPYPDGRTWCKVCRDWTHSETCPLA